MDTLACWKPSAALTSGFGPGSSPRHARAGGCSDRNPAELIESHTSKVNLKGFYSVRNCYFLPQTFAGSASAAQSQGAALCPLAAGFPFSYQPWCLGLCGLFFV